MKTLTLSALALTVLAGAASASTAHDFKRFGVEPGDLTVSQELKIQNAISSDNSHNDVQALVNSIVNKG